MPLDFRFEPRSPRYGPFLVLGRFDTNWAHAGPFLDIFGPFLGHIMDLEGNKGLFVTRKSRRIWCVATVSLRWSGFNGLRAVLGEKRLFWGTNCAVLGGHLPTWRPRPGAPPVIFWLKTWIWQGHHLGSRMARLGKDVRRCDGAMAKTERRSVACLLARFKGRGCSDISTQKSV